jgi:hypothetical protein
MGITLPLLVITVSGFLVDYLFARRARRRRRRH